jgi:hypothetical protein
MCDRNFIVAGLSHQDSMPLYDSFDELLRGHVGHRLDGSSWIIAHIGRKLATADDARAVAFVRLAVYVNTEVFGSSPIRVTPTSWVERW